ncbi:SCO family protein [Collimonas sp.]|jgi:protein SCO1/2|uniref:SCO family protein n=1 Tax=Collimonas sp. TaxID=1963772 RepID=UPI0037C0A8CA
MKRVKPVICVLAGLLLALSLVACGDKSGAGSQEMTLSPAKSEFINTDVTGLGYARDFALIDHTGKPRTLADYKGKAVVVFFGYTQCPDVCPTTMAEMANVMKELGLLASKVQVLFVTVDPQRDTQELLSKYVPAFDPSFVGLYGDQAATEKVAKEFRVFYQKVPGKTPGSYSMDHTAGSYVFDPEGHIRLFIRHGQGPDPIAHDLKLLLS